MDACATAKWKILLMVILVRFHSNYTDISTYGLPSGENGKNTLIKKISLNTKRKCRAQNEKKHSENIKRIGCNGALVSLKFSANMKIKYKMNRICVRYVCVRVILSSCSLTDLQFKCKTIFICSEHKNAF